MKQLDKDAYINWLLCLYLLISKIRKEGLMSIESDIEEPQTSRIFKFFNLPSDEYKNCLTFMTDILRLMVGGNLNADEMQEVISQYKQNIIDDNVERNMNSNKHLLDAIWFTLKSTIQGYSPQVAVDFGRMAVPPKYQPTYQEFEDKIRKTKGDFNNYIKSSSNNYQSFNEELESFIKSISS